jgi:phosphoenolpyruvate carboxykinase (ATP)
MDFKSKKTISLSSHGINNSRIFYQLSSEDLHQITVLNKLGEEVDSGALAVNTGEFTGRSPMDRFIVKDNITDDKVWWGDVNISFKSSEFDELYKRVIKYLDGKSLYVRDCFACADPSNKLSVRIINEYPWSNMFAYNMFLRPLENELNSFKQDWTVINAPGFLAQKEIKQGNIIFQFLIFLRKLLL